MFLKCNLALRTRYPPAPTSATPRKFEGKLLWIYFSQVLLPKFPLGQYFGCNISAICWDEAFHFFVFKGEKADWFVYSNERTQKRSKSCFYFDIIKWPRSCHPELLRTITEVSTGNVFLWAFPGMMQEWRLQAGKFWMHGLAPNSNPSCFPLNANRQESFGSLAHIQVAK